MPNPDRTVSDVVYRRQIPETIIEGRRLGRHVHHDPRSLSFPAQQAAKHAVRVAEIGWGRAR